MNNIGCKLIVCLILVGSYFFFPKYGFTSPLQLLTPNSSLLTANSSLLTHFLYPFSHANIWHLLANCLCLFMLRCPLHIIITYLIAVLCSFLPCPLFIDMLLNSPLGETEGVTMGFSGVLFAIVGISWGKVGRFREMLSKNIWFLIIPAFIPHINFLIHLYCLLAGYAAGKYLPQTTKRPTP